MRIRNAMVALVFLHILLLQCAARTPSPTPGADAQAQAKTETITEETSEATEKQDTAPMADASSDESDKKTDESAEANKCKDAKKGKDDNKDKKDDKHADKHAGKDKAEKPSITKHETTIDGELIKYRAIAGTMPMKDEHGKLKANVFFVAYEKSERPLTTSNSASSAAADSKNDKSAKNAETGAADSIADSTGTEPAGRPITFVFNGGPGAAAVWLHLGTAGPRRIALKENGEAPAPPYRLVDNAYSWLDATDLVFIDPVGTGFSRPAKGEKREQFYGVTEDIDWVADFIRLYITEYERWASPMFLAGESYGTTRAAGLSEHLLHRYGIALNGIIFISSVLDFQTLIPKDSNDLPYPLYLPTYAAIAWHHKKLDEDLQASLKQTVSEVERWAIGPYTTALAQGDALSSERRQAVIEKLSRYTSLPADFIDKANLRIKPEAFSKRLLADQQKLIGRFDARITGFDPEPTSSWPKYDPSFRRYWAIYSATFNDYVRRTLKYESTLPYEVISLKVRPWKFGEEGGLGYLSVAGKLRSAMVQNPHLKIMFASGRFDLATPFFATDYTINRMNLSPELSANITTQYYLGGHMMYHNRPSLKKLKNDIATFIRSALPTENTHTDNP